MPKYTVEVAWRLDVEGTQSIVVEADSEEQARELAGESFDYYDASETLNQNDFLIQGAHATLAKDEEDDEEQDTEEVETAPE